MVRLWTVNFRISSSFEDLLEKNIRRFRGTVAIELSREHPSVLSGPHVDSFGEGATKKTHYWCRHRPDSSGSDGDCGPPSVRPTRHMEQVRGGY